MQDKNNNTQFTLSLKEYLDDKFKVISQRIDSLVSSIETLIKDTNHTKDRVTTLEIGFKNIKEELRIFKGVFRNHMRIIVCAFLIGTIIWVPETRKAIINIFIKYLGF